MNSVRWNGLSLEHASALRAQHAKEVRMRVEQDFVYRNPDHFTGLIAFALNLEKGLPNVMLLETISSSFIQGIEQVKRHDRCKEAMSTPQNKALIAKICSQLLLYESILSSLSDTMSIEIEKKIVQLCKTQEDIIIRLRKQRQDMQTLRSALEASPLSHAIER